jgi:MYXO-CTERM domain-containing protein
VKRALTWPVLAAGLLGAPAAYADAVPQAPETCPPGTIGQSSHAGPFCRVTTCSTDADCERWSARKQYVCRRVAPVCVGEMDVSAPHMRVPDAGRGTTKVADAACGPGGTCSPGWTCETASRCVDADGPAAAGPSGGTGTGKSGCGCRVGAEQGGDVVAAIGAGALLVGIARRRRERRT